jgi:hypothetical protein
MTHEGRTYSEEWISSRHGSTARSVSCSRREKDDITCSGSSVDRWIEGEGRGRVYNQRTLYRAGRQRVWLWREARERERRVLMSRSQMSNSVHLHLSDCVMSRSSEKKKLKRGPDR